MSPADTALLAQIELRASVQPCQLPRADLLRLLTLAGFGHGTAVYKEMAGKGDPVVVEWGGVLVALKWARSADVAPKV